MSKNAVGTSVIGCIVFLLVTVGFADPFAIVALPDTQFYSGQFPQTFTAQTQWIVDHRDDQRIVFVTHLGDIVDVAERHGQWHVARDAMSLLDGRVPYSVCIGNHDVGESRYYDRHFGPWRYASKLWYGGHSPNGRSHWQRFTGDGRSFLHLNLETDAKSDTPDEALAWGNEIMSTNHGVPTILSTHNYLGMNGRTANGQKIWDRLVRFNPQVFMTLNGHTAGEASQISVNDAGTKVIEMLANYQDEDNGGNGFMRLIRFDPERERIAVTSFSPLLVMHRSGEFSNLRFAVHFGEGSTLAVKGVEEKRPAAERTVLAGAPR